MLAHRTSVLAALAVLVAGAIGLGASAACTVLTNDALPDEAGLFEAGDTDASAEACSTCVAAACAAPEALCFTDPGCTGVVACAAAAGCGDTCRTSCACDAVGDGGASPERLHHAYFTCIQAAPCSTECSGATANAAPITFGACEPDPLDGGPDAESDGGAAPASCEACAATNCGAQVSTCGSGTECQAFLACSSACTTGSCVDDCARLHATGKVAASELATCTVTSCKIDCQL